MTKGVRVVCPSCKKVNQGSRDACMYCNQELAGATLASDDMSNYVSPDRSGFPWMGALTLLALAGAVVGYFFWYVPMQRGEMARELIVSQEAFETITFDKAVEVTVQLDWSDAGSGSIVLQPEGGTADQIQEKSGSSPLEIRAKLAPGSHHFTFKAPSDSARAKIWKKSAD